ncbi:calmodulin-binding receptor-like cytoplasmic kinase 2 [Selaginella moellendorffii]|uniref:calmodulin-binding receptor-like cytoplasmic kinase 2 n=1 Tax=Selaginella moellendorffii TaxID=88036 RepID=UPI000D1D1142|nr:calmodulin-binding receptor-like cytoplasmic kinase 2 [Selaginella moellendorffii]|eukprot:XP_002968448.2 calmodulin-binding receptor-like cytoplasmic kinase 2 [Selaginella moellendorffii]
MLCAIALLLALALYGTSGQGCKPGNCGQVVIPPPFSCEDSPFFLSCEDDKVRISNESYTIVAFLAPFVVVDRSPPALCAARTCRIDTSCGIRVIGEWRDGLGCYPTPPAPGDESRYHAVIQFDRPDYSCNPDLLQLHLATVVNCSRSASLSSPSLGSGRTSKTRAIVGGSVGGGLGVLFLLGCVCCVARRRRLAAKQRGLILGDDPKQPPPQLLSKSGRIVYSNNSGSYGTSNSYGSSVSVTVENGDGGSNSSRFSYRELQEATNNFSEDGRLGDGGFGTVYKGKLRDGRLVAVKKLNPWNAQGKYQFDNEVTILSRVTHPHLVRLYGCCIEQELLLVYEFVAHGTLADHLYDNPRDYLGWDARLTVAVQCAEALAFLHTNVCYHRDVKSTNILLDERYHCKVGDFGLSRLVPSLELTHITTAPQGTPGYLDPDYHQSYQLTDKSDVYSLGVVLMELVSSQRAVDMARERKEINLAALAVSRIQCGELDKLVDPRLGAGEDSVRQRMVECVAELGFECLATEKEDRPCMKDVAARLRAIEEEGKQRYLEQMVAIRKVEVVDDDKKHTRSSPTSVQMQWPSNSTSPNDSSSSM